MTWGGDKHNRSLALHVDLVAVFHHHSRVPAFGSTKGAFGLQCGVSA